MEEKLIVSSAPCAGTLCCWKELAWDLRYGEQELFVTASRYDLYSSITLTTWFVHWPIASLPWKFHANTFGSFCAKLLTDRQTDKQTTTIAYPPWRKQQQIIMAALRNRAGHFIFCPVVSSSFSIFLSFFLALSQPSQIGCLSYLHK